MKSPIVQMSHVVSFPVLRLDNNEPLDLNYGGGAYYNPGLQGDNIQMTNIPGRHRNWKDYQDQSHKLPCKNVCHLVSLAFDVEFCK